MKHTTMLKVAFDLNGKYGLPNFSEDRMRQLAPILAGAGVGAMTTESDEKESKTDVLLRALKRALVGGTIGYGGMALADQARTPRPSYLQRIIPVLPRPQDSDKTHSWH